MKKATYIFLLKNDDKQSSSELARPTSSLWHFLVSWLQNNQPPPRLTDCNIAREQERRSPWFRHPWNQEWNGLLHHAIIKCRCPFFSKWECPDSGWTYVLVTMESPYYLYIKHFWLSFQLQTLTAKRRTCHTTVTLTILQLYISFTTALWILSRIEQKLIKWRLDMKSVYNWSNYPCHPPYHFFK